MHEFKTLNRDLSDTKSSYIKPGDTSIFRCIADVNISEDVKLDDYSVNPPTKTKTSYKDVQRERQVTAYRLVTKYRTEQQCN